VGVPRWLAAHNQREAATIENSTSAMPVATCVALRIKRSKDRGEPAQASLSAIWPSSDMQNAMGGSARRKILH